MPDTPPSEPSDGPVRLLLGRGASFEGLLHTVDVSGSELVFGEPWSLLTDADRREDWRIGGAQHLAVHEGSGRLFSLVHQGGVDTHKQAGSELWVYDLAAREPDSSTSRFDRTAQRAQIGSVPERTVDELGDRQLPERKANHNAGCGISQSQALHRSVGDCTALLAHRLRIAPWSFQAAWRSLSPPLSRCRRL